MPIDCQSKRRDVYTAAQRGRRDVVDIVKNFSLGGEPQQELDTATTTTSLRILQLIIRSTASTTSVALPSSRTADNTILRKAPRTATEPYTPREICDEPLIPHSTQTAWTYRAVFCSPLYLNLPAAGDRE